MQQIIQNVRNGEVKVVSAPDPLARPGQVLIANACSLISAGTEKMALELAKKSLVGKARKRPDLVRRMVQKMSQEGFFQTLAQIQSRLDEPMATGYSSAGVVLAVGAGVQGFRPGDRVASNGPHAGVVCVPQHLCALVPETVSFDQAAFTVMGAIALQGGRLARLNLGETAFVIGLGLIGQITAALLKAQGCRVIATDPDEGKCKLALGMGADRAAAGLGAAEVADFTRGLGADAVLITASTKSDAPVELAGEAVRQKGRVVAVGAVGLNLPRRPYYFKEAEFVVSMSYGPGRYDPLYEERGQDYPAAYVRWTEQRNMQAVLDLMAAGRLNLAPLISHRFKIEEAEKAYDLIESGREPYLGIVLEYPDTAARKPEPSIELRATAATGKVSYACLGAGGFGRAVILPALRKIPGLHPRILCAAGAAASAQAGEKQGFDILTTDEDMVFKDPEVRAVFILTRHNLHAPQVLKALQSGKSVFVEKPLCLTLDELAAIESALQPSLLMVGFNRRFSPSARTVKAFFADVQQPLTLAIRFNAGEIPADHWTQDDQAGGGRIIGEACHAMDLATYLTGSLPVRVFAECVGGPQAGPITHDQAAITLRHANGSISSILYTAGGDRAFPKERVEVFGGGRTAVIEDFHEVITVAGGKTRRQRASGQDKGHQAELQAFAEALTRGGPAPIAWAELKAVTAASIFAVQSLREGCPIDFL